ncbi:glutaredoxin family protein [Halobacillus yeomjeoni]|uniref:Glutaredoxin family protein n=1 Tax=Halobacillus yeomjeoni TaxID=311194 RepID=A0A931HWE2_9BACI|nr:glutaredoxin family protein [Halobacillus yeomjeoni]MBH0230945.1 glutaredoxin family protein [Halobacillus yeomjeoni]
MNTIVMYTKKQCPLCDEVESLVDLMASSYEIDLEEVDIEQDDRLLEKYMFEVPVLVVNGEEIGYEAINYVSLEKRLHKKNGG